MKDFLVIGDVTTDNIIQITDSEIINSIDNCNHTMTLPFPSKVQLEKPPKVIGGGNAFTVSHALSKLGLQTMLYSVRGEDFPGRKLIDDLADAGVDTSLVAVDKTTGTNSSFILAVGKDRLILSHHYDREYKIDEMPDVKHVFLTSIGEDDRKLFRQLLRHKQKKYFTLFFSPGTRQIREEFMDIKDILAHTDYLILNKREAIEMSRLNTEHNETLMRELAKHGPKNIIMTRSHKGSIGFDGENFHKVGARRVTVVEPTGAGDTFAATFAAGIASSKPLQVAMEWGAVNASEVCTQIGCVDWQLNAQQLTEMHAQQKEQLKYTNGNGDH